MTNLAEIRAQTKKRRLDEVDSIEELPKESNKRAKLPAFLEKKEREASIVRGEIPAKREVPAFLRSPKVELVE